MTDMTKNQKEFVLDQLKAETANEMGIELGADQISRLNGAVGGRMVQKLVQIAEEALTYAKDNGVR
jgi:hypothetical protein